MNTIIYKNVNILDGNKNMQLQKNKAIIVENNKIKSIINNNEIPEGIKTIDLNNKYVIPGLINLHCHLAASGKPMNYKKTNSDMAGLLDKVLKNKFTRPVIEKMCYSFTFKELLSGVTTIRTVGGLDTIDSTLRDKINSGKLVGPNILASDKAISVPNGHMTGLLAYGAKTNNEALQYLDEIAKTKPDLIKLMITGGVLDSDESGHPGALKMTPEMVKVCCDRAHELGYYVAAHVESSEGVKVALENGVDTVEHGSYLDDELINLFKEKNAKLVCTISPAIPLKLLDPSTFNDPNYNINGTIVCDGIIEGTKQALKNNITVGLGNDVGCPYVTHYDFWRELVYFNKFAGVSVNDTLHTATKVNASILNMDDIIGTIEPNKLADMVVLNDNPLDNLETLRNVYMVIKNGKIIKGKLKKYKDIDNILDNILLNF